MSLKIIFMGTSTFAIPTLQTLISEGFEIPCVYTQNPKASGRGHKIKRTPVQALAESHGLPIRTPSNFNSPVEQDALRRLAADVIVVVAYGIILPSQILSAPRLGCVNLHASNLPRWRGAAPIQRAIMAGDKTTGVTAMLMDDGLDTGAILLNKTVKIAQDSTAGDIHDLLAQTGPKVMTKALLGLSEGSITPLEQTNEGATYAKKISKPEARIDWHLPAHDIANKIRGLSPNPGAWCELNKKRIKILRAKIATGMGQCGMVLEENLTVACGKDAIQIIELQRDGGVPLPYASFLRGLPIKPGAIFE